MDHLDKLSIGEKIAGGSAILLFVFMFFDWFGVEVSGVGGFSGTVPGAGGSAWDALDFIPFVLLITVIAALAMAGLRLADSAYEPPVPMSTIVAVLGAISVVMILFRIVFPPDLGSFGGVTVDATLKLGIFLGLISAVGIAYGGYSTMKEEGITFADAADGLSRGGGPGPGGPGGGTGTQPPASAPPPPPSSQAPPPPSSPPPPPPAS